MMSFQNSIIHASKLQTHSSLSLCFLNFYEYSVPLAQNQPHRNGTKSTPSERPSCKISKGIKNSW